MCLVLKRPARAPGLSLREEGTKDGGRGWGGTDRPDSLTCRAFRSSSAGDLKHICMTPQLSLGAVVARGTELTVFL